MKHLLRSTALSLAVLATPVIALAADSKPPAPAPAAPAKAPQADVPVKIVVLFSSGVGYFEHVGHVTGDSATELRFKTNQINDILKSLVLQDLGGGKISSIVYPSLDPIGKILRSFQVDITGNPPLADLLNQLRGAKIKIQAGTENLAGTILGVEKKPKAVEKGHIDIWVLNLIAGGTIRSISLDDLTKLELEDPQLQDELHKALTALGQARDQDKKPVTINFQGQGQRIVRVGYVVETPVWKTSYRLLLSTKPGDKSGLQGWAIVENQTDNDWTNIQLSLVSGRPISFIQELYQPIYIPRPVVQPELYGSLRPQTYDAGIDTRRAEKLAEAEGGAGGPGRARELAKAAPAPSKKPAPGWASGAAADRFSSADELVQEALQKSIDASASVASVASATKIGELFQYTVGNVSLPRQRSAMLPIITDTIQVERLSIYNPAVLPRNPLYGARLKNTTNDHLLGGPITVLEGSSYAGDARIDNVPPGQERLISYGVDLQMLVNSTKNTQTSSIVSGKIVKGVLQLQRKHQSVQDYIVDNKDTKDKTLIIEHPFRRGWKLISPEKPLETTETLYRFQQTIPAGKTTTIPVKEEIVQGETIALLPADAGSLEFYSKSGELSKDVKDALLKAILLKHAQVDAQRQVDKLRQKVDEIARDQARIRENIKVAPDKSAQKTRLLEKLDEQDKQIDELYKQMDDAQKNVEKQRKELESYLSELNVGQ